jgi:perosamine synthetase
MIRKLPIVACPLRLRDIFASSALSREGLREELAQRTRTKHLYFTNSATSSFYVILEAMKRLRGKKEVILPAYTASSLIYAIKKTGLRAVLCDISLDDFNMNASLLGKAITSDTLCIVGVHMFGIVQTGLKGLKQDYPEIFIVEDGAQAMGTLVDGSWAGALGDVAFFSFNRGKNIPTYGGGFLATNNEEISKAVRIVLEEKGISGKGASTDATVALKMLALSIAANPWAYGLLYSFISCFKEVPAQKDFRIADYSDFQAGIAFSLLQKERDFSKTRYANGMRLKEGLKNQKEIILPKIPVNSEPAFNRLPILFKDIRQREEAQKNLRRAGIESSRMYYKPLHHVFDLGYGQDQFPHAVYLAERLLTLPVHPLVKEKDLTKMIAILNR